MLVQKNLVPQFIEIMVDRVKKLKAGSGLEEGVAIGPLVNESAIEKVDKQVKDAVE